MSHCPISKHGWRRITTLTRTRFDDIRGQRTGFQTKYSGHGISFNHWIGSTIAFRSEVRYNHPYDAPAFNNDTKSQLMFAGDMSFFY
jgi:hypothetical protein